MVSRLDALAQAATSALGREVARPNTRHLTFKFPSLKLEANILFGRSTATVEFGFAVYG
jgi:hypothetical protein